MAGKDSAIEQAKKIAAALQDQGQEQADLEALQAQEKQIESQEVLRRRLAALRRMQGGGSGTRGIDTSLTNPDSTLG